MFNSSLKKEALRIHKDTSDRYNSSYKTMGKECELLYEKRQNSVGLIKQIEKVINSIANTPKEFDVQMGKVGKELTKFRETETYAQEAYKESLKAGANILGGAATGMGVASIAPTALMSIATTFGTASTGTAISALSGAAAQKAAVAWIGRTFAGFAVKEGAGMAVGNAFLALAGPIGWGITAASAGFSLISLTNNNKKLADEAVEEAKNISKAREALDETTEKVKAVRTKTETLYNDMEKDHDKIMSFMNKDYSSLESEQQLYLGALVNNTFSLSVLLNETVS